MKWQVIKIRVLRTLKKIVLYSVYAGLVLFIVAFGTLQIPSVQKGLIERLVGGFSAVSGFDIQIEKFYLLWYDRLEITGLTITDPEHHTMVEAGRLFINFRLASLLENKNVNLDAVSLQGGVVNLITIAESDTSKDLNFNIFIAEINKQLSSGQPGGGSTRVNIGEVLVEQSRFSYNRTDRDSVEGFDPNHFSTALDAGNLNNFKIIGDTIEFQVESLQIKEEKTQLMVRELSTFFRISQQSMEFLGLNLSCNESHISDTVVMRFQSQDDLSDFNNKVSLHAHLNNTRLHPKDLSFFTSLPAGWTEPVLLNGLFNGRVSRFTFRPMEIVSGSSRLKGSLQMDGLPSINETFINARLTASTVHTRDIAFLLPDNVAANLGPLGKVQLNGKFVGFVNDFVANGDFNTPFGQIESDINYKIAENNISQSAYIGQLTLTDFDLGRFLNDTLNIQKVTMHGRINGKGFTEKTADFTLLGEIASIGLRGYDYSHIRSNARFANQFFQGELSIDDPNLRFLMTGSIDLRQGKDLINIGAKLDTALLRELHLSSEDIFLRSDFQIKSKGLTLDSIVGQALFQKTAVGFHNNTIMLDSMRLVSENENGDRSLTLRSSLADLSLKGDFYYSSLFNDIERLIREFLLNIRNDPFAIRQYYQSKRKSDQAYKAIIRADLRDINPIFKVLGVNVHTSRGTRVQGEFSNNTTSNLHVYTTLDTLMVDGLIFSGNEVDFAGSKVRDSTQVLAQLTINSLWQRLNKTVTTRNLFAEGIWNRDHIDLGFDVDQEGYDNSLRLRSEIDFLHDSTKIKVRPSVIKILGEGWTINDRNFTLVQGQEWDVHHLGITHLEQSIKIDGAISHDPGKVLNVDISNFDVSFFNFFSAEKFKGLLNAKIKQRDIYTNGYMENILSIDSLTINNFLVGDVRGNNTKDPASDQFNIDLTIDRFNNRIVDVKGYYNPLDKESPLHTRAILEKANLKLIEPVVRDLFSNLDGTVTGAYDIQGTFSNPNVSGEARIDNGQLMINYMKTLYKVTGTLGITHDQIQFINFDITDAFRNKGRLGGYIAHRSFSKMRLNLDASFSNFQLLNTTSKDNSLFYGQAFGTGTLNILGPVSNLKISSTVRSDKNTRLSIPVGGTSTQEKKEFIQFSNFTDSLKKKVTVATTSKREISGLTLDLNIDVTPDAYAEIIFDIKSGDIIRGRGRGDLLLQIDTKGDFNMFGLMEFTEGAYNFTLYDIINKEFTIKPGSRITWFGDPYEGILNITASYRQLASMGPILSDQTLVNDPNIRRKYPVEVLLKLDGPMLSPQINFDIEAKDLPNNINVTVDGKVTSVNLKFQFNAFKTKLDEQELKRQVFSLIILRKFSPPDAFATGGSLYNSVSELLSNQLSYWFSQVDQNLEVDLDLGTMDQEAFNTFQLRLSYSFLNGRLRVTRDGSLGNQTNRSELSTIAGDWTVDYLLTPDGKFKVKMFSRSSVNQLQSSLNTQTAAVTTGVSLLYTENFNEFKDLLRSARDRRRKELENNPPQDEADDIKGGH